MSSRSFSFVVIAVLSYRRIFMIREIFPYTNRSRRIYEEWMDRLLRREEVIWGTDTMVLGLSAGENSFICIGHFSLMSTIIWPELSTLRSVLKIVLISSPETWLTVVNLFHLNPSQPIKNTLSRHEIATLQLSPAKNWKSMENPFLRSSTES